MRKSTAKRLDGWALISRKWRSFTHELQGNLRQNEESQAKKQQKIRLRPKKMPGL